jgi:lysozyme
MSTGKYYTKNELLSKLRESDEVSNDQEITNDPLSLIKKISSFITVYKGDLDSDKVADVYYTPTGIIIYIDYVGENKLPISLKDSKEELIQWVKSSKEYHFEDNVKQRRLIGENRIINESSYTDKDNNGMFSVLYNLLTKRLSEDEVLEILKKNDAEIRSIVADGPRDYKVTIGTDPIAYMFDEDNYYTLQSLVSGEGDLDMYIDSAWEDADNERMYWDILLPPQVQSEQNYPLQLAKLFGIKGPTNEFDYSQYIDLDEIDAGLEYKQFIDKLKDFYVDANSQAHNNGLIEEGGKYYEKWRNDVEEKLDFDEGWDKFSFNVKYLFSLIAQNPSKANNYTSFKELFIEHKKVSPMFGAESMFGSMGMDDRYDYWDSEIYEFYQNKALEEAKDFLETWPLEHEMELKEYDVAKDILKSLGLTVPANDLFRWTNRTHRVSASSNIEGFYDLDAKTQKVLERLDNRRVLIPKKQPKDILPFKNAGLTQPILIHHKYDFMEEEHVIVGLSTDMSEYNIIRLSNQKFKAVIDELGLVNMSLDEAINQLNKPKARYMVGDKVRYKDEYNDVKATVFSATYNPKGGNWLYGIKWPSGQYGGSESLTVQDDEKLSLSESKQGTKVTTPITVYYAVTSEMIKHYGEEKVNLLGDPNRIEVSGYNISIYGDAFAYEYKGRTSSVKAKGKLAKKINGSIVQYPNPEVLYDIIPKEKDYGVKSPFMDGTKMRASQKFWDHIKFEEGSVKERGKPVLNAYDLKDGRITIGWGHTKDVKMGDVITPQQAQKFLQEDAKWAADCVRRLMTKWKNEKNDAYMVTQPIFDVLVSLAFNAGCGGLRKSEFIQLVKKRNYQGAAKLLPVDSSMKNAKFDKALTARRQREAKWMLE